MGKEKFFAHQVEVSAVVTYMKIFYLTYPVPSCGRDKNTLIDKCRHCYVKVMPLGTSRRIFLKYENTVFYGEQEIINIICKRVG